MQKQLKVMIGGKQYTVAATDESEHDIYRAAQLVDALLQDKLEKLSHGNNDKASLIVALQLGIDLVKYQQQLLLYEKRVEQLALLLAHEV